MPLILKGNGDYVPAREGLYSAVCGHAVAQLLGAPQQMGVAFSLGVAETLVGLPPSMIRKPPKAGPRISPADPRPFARQLPLGVA